MKAVVFTRTREVATAEVADATPEEQADVLLRVTSSAVCGTDLHMYDRRTGATPGLVLGHEPLGVVAKAGPAVEMVKPGDRVVIPTHLYCGVCVNSARGLSARGRTADRAVGHVLHKGVSVGFGRTHDRRYAVLLRGLILSGRARPGTIVTHHGWLDDAPALYREFDERSAGVIKAVLQPRPG